MDQIQLHINIKENEYEKLLRYAFSQDEMDLKVTPEYLANVANAKKEKKVNVVSMDYLVMLVLEDLQVLPDTQEKEEMMDNLVLMALQDSK